MVTIRVHETEYTCTLSERFRRHTPNELERMRESITSVGIQVPVCLYFDTTLSIDNCVLDGEGRLTTVASLPEPVPVPIDHRGEMSTDEAYELAKVLNDHRRQDSPEAIQKRRAERIARVAEARNEGKSLRAIAQAEGVSLGQVQRDLREPGVSGDTPVTPDRVVGSDGKSYPTARPAPEEPEPEEPEPDPLEEDDPEQGCVTPAPPAPVRPAPEATITAVPDSRPERRPSSRLKPGFNGDPDHPFARSLNAMTALVKALNADMREDESGFLKNNLSLLTTMTVKQRQVMHTSGLIRDGKQTPPAAKFVGLALLRSLVRNSGAMKKKMTLVQLRKLYDQIEAAPESQVLTAEGDDE